MDNIDLKWELFKNSKESKEGKTFEDFKEWLRLKKISIPNEALLENYCHTNMKDEMDPSIVCGACDGHGIKQYDDTCDLFGFPINHNPGYDLCKVCHGLGAVSNKVYNSLLF